MFKLNSEKIEYISPGEAAKMLGVSTYTVRRWHHKGILVSKEVKDKSLLFELKKIQGMVNNRLLSISEAAKSLNLSVSSLRRLEKRGLLVPSRNKSGKKLYSRELLDKYLSQNMLLSEQRYTVENYSSFRYTLLGMAFGIILLSLISGFKETVPTFNLSYKSSIVVETGAISDVLMLSTTRVNRSHSQLKTSNLQPFNTTEGLLIVN